MRNARLLADMTPAQIQKAVRSAYGRVAEHPHGEFPFPVGRQFAESVGYPPEVLDRVPAALSESFTGAGNPQFAVDVQPGETLLDLGCGAGLDLWFYAQKAGSRGRLYGLDFSPAMIETAQSGLRAAGVETVTLLLAPAERIPLDDETVDIVTSNGIYNLSPDKPAVMREVHRVLRPGGRTIFSEVVLREPTEEKLCRELRDWFRCIGGALAVNDFLRLLEANGLARPQVLDLRRNARTGHPAAVCATIRAERSA